MIRTTIIAAVASIVFLAVAPAHASIDPYKDRSTIVVKIADLDLGEARDQAILMRRVDRAARRICDAEVTFGQRRQCARETVEYTLNLAPKNIRRAYAAASDRRDGFALAQN